MEFDFNSSSRNFQFTLNAKFDALKGTHEVKLVFITEQTTKKNKKDKDSFTVQLRIGQEFRVFLRYNEKLKLNLPSNKILIDNPKSSSKNSSRNEITKALPKRSQFKAGTRSNKTCKN